MGRFSKRCSYDDILYSLRRRICLADPFAETLLHEGSLSKEFGVSRTPVRQVLQRLAYERLVAIIPGVGTIIVPLESGRRHQDIRASYALLRCAAACAVDREVPEDTRAVLAETIRRFEQRKGINADLLFDARYHLTESVAEIIDDEVISEAFRATSWRLTRWRLHDFQVGRHEEIQRFERLLCDVEASLDVLSVPELLDALAGLDPYAPAPDSVPGGKVVPDPPGNAEALIHFPEEGSESVAVKERTSQP